MRLVTLSYLIPQKKTDRVVVIVILIRTFASNRDIRVMCLCVRGMTITFSWSEF